MEIWIQDQNRSLSAFNKMKTVFVSPKIFRPSKTKKYQSVPSHQDKKDVEISTINKINELDKIEELLGKNYKYIHSWLWKEKRKRTQNIW